MNLATMLKRRPPVVTVTPELAQEFINASFQNGQIRNRRALESFASQMRNGEWDESNPKPMIWSASGKLLDGNHRCAALIKAGVPLEFHMAYDRPESLFDILGAESPRAPGQVIAIKNGINCTDGKEVCAILARVYKYMNNINFYTQPIDLRTLEALFDEYREAVLYFLPIARAKPFATWLPQTVSVAYLVLMEKLHNRELVEEFFRSIQTGDCPKDSAIWVGRESIISKATQKKAAGRTKVDLLDSAAILVRTWNYWLKKTSHPKTYISGIYGSGRDNKTFPEIE